MEDRELKPEEITWNGKRVTAKHGLLYITGQMIGLPEAAQIAVAYGFTCAERLVKFLGGASK